ncbi:MAG: hypothetical protein IJ766_01205 [Clostridia bacterium]|nr:hypothetical protein [Clostridia bacterium]
MDGILNTLLRLSFQASFFILAVALLRPTLLRRAPKAIRLALWALVAVRLLLPFSVESAFSLIPASTLLTGGKFTAYESAYTTPSAAPAVPATGVPSATAPALTATGSQGFALSSLPALLWLLGFAAMTLYAVVSYGKLQRKVREFIPYQDNIRLCDRIDTPFIFGILRPKIYLPSTVSDADAAYVLAHERAHLRHGDHLWKPLGFALLCLHWFNPCLWLGYILFCRDLEYACDERVLKSLGADEKKSYAHALIDCSAPRRGIAACPLAFGEAGVKQRVKSVLHYKKPAFWIILTAVLCCIALAICLLTSPIQRDTNTYNFIAAGASPPVNGISVEIDKFGVDKDPEKTQLRAVWRNATGQEFVIGGAFCLYICDANGDYIPCAPAGDDPLFTALGYVIPPHGETGMLYDLSLYAMPEDGRYRAYLNGFDETAFYLDFTRMTETGIEGNAYVYEKCYYDDMIGAKRVNAEGVPEVNMYISPDRSLYDGRDGDYTLRRQYRLTDPADEYYQLLRAYMPALDRLSGEKALYSAIEQQGAAEAPNTSVYFIALMNNGHVYAGTVDTYGGAHPWSLYRLKGVAANSDLSALPINQNLMNNER